MGVLSNILPQSSTGWLGVATGDPTMAASGNRGKSAMRQPGQVVSNVGKSIDRPANQVGRKIDERAAPSHLGGSINYDTANMYSAGLSGNQHLEAGGRNDSIFGGAKSAALKKAQASEQAQLTQQQQNEQNLINQANATYGVGQSPTALQNRQTLSNLSGQVGNANLASGLSAADANYQSSLTSGRGALARAGLLNSPAQGQLLADVGTQHTSDVLGAQTGGQQAQQTLADQQMQQRLGLVSQIRGGQVTDTTGLNSQIAALGAQSTGANVAGNVIGSFLPQAAGTVSNRAQVQAAGS